VITTEPVPTRADITVETIFTGKALALDISALTTGQVRAIGVMAMEVIPTEGKATGGTAIGVMVTGVTLTAVTRTGVTRTGVTRMEVIRAEVTRMEVMAMGVTAMGVTRAEVNPPRAVRNDVTGPIGIHSSLDTSARQSRDHDP
jgi:hypothetical protein